MPPKRTPGRPPAPAAPPSTSKTVRVPLHTQELMLFSSPITNTTETKRSSSLSKRGSGNLPVTRTGVQPRSSSHRRPAPSSSSSGNVLATRAPTEYEELPGNFYAVSSPSLMGFSSAISGGSAALSSTGSWGGHIPSPPQRQRASPVGGVCVTKLPASAAGPLAASGSGSRVIRLLRDARAAVRDPIRPDTPLEAHAALYSDIKGVSTASIARGGSNGPLLRGPRDLESRYRRCLPAGGRLEPMTQSSTAAVALPTLSTCAAAAVLDSGPRGRDSVELGSPPGGRPSMSVLSRTSLSSSHTAATAKPYRSGEGEAAYESPSPLTLTSSTGFEGDVDADRFAQLYPSAQQAGETGVPLAVDLLLRLKATLQARSCSSLQRPIDNAGAVACLQTTLLHFCQYWSAGAALRAAVSGCGTTTSPVLPSEDPERGSDAADADAASVPLLYAQSALLAATLLAQSYPAAVLIAEPISFNAIVCAIHAVAEAGLALWVVQERVLFNILVEFLRALLSSATNAEAPTWQWTLWILQTIELCCQEAARVGEIRQGSSVHNPEPQGSDAVTSRGQGRRRTNGESDMIRGSGLVDADYLDRPSNPILRAPSCASASVSSLMQLLPQSPPAAPAVSGFTVAGSPLNAVRSGSRDGGSSATMLGAEEMCTFESLTAHLVSLKFLSFLQQLGREVVGGCASPLQSSASSAQLPPPVSVLPVIASLYRMFVQSYAVELRECGAMTLLVDVLKSYATDTATVEAVARALVKMTYVEDSLEEMQADTSVIIAAGHALRVQLANDATVGASSSPIDLLVSRLCGVIARVAEGNTTQQECLVSPMMTQLLETLALRYVSVRYNPGEQESANLSRLLQSTPVLQAVVWVLGIASISPHFPLHLVKTVTPLLVELLEELRRFPTMQLTGVYVLMCLSNLSYFFGALDSGIEKSTSVGGTEEGVGMAEWLSSLYTSLGLLVAHYLFEDNVEATVEATRILGNVSYTNAGRDWMEANRCDEVIVLFLGHEDLRVVYNCCGVLLNLTAASPCRVVQEPELLRMLLSYTSRYTVTDKINAVAALEEARLRQEATLPHLSEGSAAGEICAREASSHAKQVADVVEKLLLNIKGLLSLSTPLAEGLA